MGGMGSPTHWQYRGRDIIIRPPGHKFGGKSPYFWAEWKDWDYLGGDKENEVASGLDEQSALANARHLIDVREKQQQYPDYLAAHLMVNHVIDAMGDHEKGPISRATVARRIEEFRRKLQKGERPEYRTPEGDWVSIHLREFGMDYFHRLPLPERVKLIDETIAYHARAGLLDPKRLSNPRKRKQKQKQKTKHSSRSIMRKLLRGT
jgi:hypothetical protein